VRKFIAVACFLTLFSLAAMAADYPKAEIFGGYQYTHLEGSYNGNGFNFALNGNFNDYFGITADFGAAYKGQNGASLNNYTYTFGPVLSLRADQEVHAVCARADWRRSRNRECQWCGERQRQWLRPDGGRRS